jgi:hypothetical protein
MMAHACHPSYRRYKQEDQGPGQPWAKTETLSKKIKQKGPGLLLTNGLRKCVIYTQWNFTQPGKRMISFAGKWMELENIILSEVSQAQKTKNRMFSLICGH